MMLRWLWENTPYIIGALFVLAVLSFFGAMVWKDEQGRILCQDRGYLVDVSVWGDLYWVRVQDGQLVGVRLRDLKAQE